MKTKYVLHGGFNKERGPVHMNDEFFAEILRDAPKELNTLLVYFAEREEIIPERIEQDKGQFLKNSAGKEITFRVTTEVTFEQDCAWANAIYLHGGKTVKLMEALDKYPNIKEILIGDKTIGGDSAGANALGKYFWSKSAQSIRKGTGILPFKIVVHYQEGTDNPLADTEPELETLLLHEYETKIIYV